MVWIQIRIDVQSGPELDPICLQRLSADDKLAASKERVNGILVLIAYK